MHDGEQPGKQSVALAFRADLAERAQPGSQLEAPAITPGTFQRVLDEVVGAAGVTHEPARVPAQAWRERNQPAGQIGHRGASEGGVLTAWRRAKRS